MNPFDGIDIHPNPNLVIKGEPEAYRRTWRDRLFTRPWRPWRAIAYRETWVPDPRVYHMDPSVMSLPGVTLGRRSYVAHPATIDKLARGIRGEHA